MSMSLEKDDYILGVWCLAGAKANWLCIVVKRADEWVIQYRFRYFRDDKAFDSQDKKSFFVARADGEKSESEIIESVDNIVSTMMDKGFGKTLERSMIRSKDMDDFMLAIRSMKSMNIMEMSKEEAIAKGFVPPEEK